jgi:hypothetical protein
MGPSWRPFSPAIEVSGPASQTGGSPDDRRPGGKAGGRVGYRLGLSNPVPDGITLVMLLAVPDVVGSMWAW